MAFQDKSIQCADCGATFSLHRRRAGVLQNQGLHQRAQAVSDLSPGQEDGEIWAPQARA